MASEKTVKLEPFQALVIQLTGPFLVGLLRVSGKFDAALGINELVVALSSGHAQWMAARGARGDARGGGPHVDLGCALNEYVTQDSMRADLEKIASKWSL